MRVAGTTIGRVQHLVGKIFQHKDTIEDHWMNAIDDEYDVYIRDYCRMTLYLVEKMLKIKILPKVVEKDTKDILDP